MTREINVAVEYKNPLILCIMIGGVILSRKLFPLLNFPLQLEYGQETRYQGETNGGALHWIRKPTISLQGRHVLIVDDILDEGTTLTAMIKECENNQAKSIYTAVLADKQLDRERILKKADFTGLTVPNRYLFGYGMDYKEYLRNAPGIYAVKGL